MNGTGIQRHATSTSTFDLSFEHRSTTLADFWAGRCISKTSRTRSSLLLATTSSMYIDKVETLVLLSGALEIGRAKLRTTTISALKHRKRLLGIETYN